MRVRAEYEEHIRKSRIAEREEKVLQREIEYQDMMLNTRRMAKYNTTYEPWEIRTTMNQMFIDKMNKPLYEKYVKNRPKYLQGLPNKYGVHMPGTRNMSSEEFDPDKSLNTAEFDAYRRMYNIPLQDLREHRAEFYDQLVPKHKRRIWKFYKKRENQTHAANSSDTHRVRRDLRQRDAVVDLMMYIENLGARMYEVMEEGGNETLLLEMGVDLLNTMDESEDNRSVENSVGNAFDGRTTCEVSSETYEQFDDEENEEVIGNPIQYRNDNIARNTEEKLNADRTSMIKKSNDFRTVRIINNNKSLLDNDIQERGKESIETIEKNISVNGEANRGFIPFLMEKNNKSLGNNDTKIECFDQSTEEITSTVNISDIIKINQWLPCVNKSTNDHIDTSKVSKDDIYINLHISDDSNNMGESHNKMYTNEDIKQFLKRFKRQLIVVNNATRNLSEIHNFVGDQMGGASVNNMGIEDVRAYLRFRIKLHEQDLINKASLSFAEKLKKLREEEIRNGTQKSHLNKTGYAIIDDGAKEMSRRKRSLREPNRLINNKRIILNENNKRLKRDTNQLGFDPIRFKLFEQTLEKRQEKKHLSEKRVRKILDDISLKMSKKKDFKTNRTQSNFTHIGDFMNIKFDKDDNLICNTQERKDLDDAINGTRAPKNKRRKRRIYEYEKPGDFEKFQELLDEQDSDENTTHPIFRNVNQSETVGYGENLFKHMENYLGHPVPDLISTPETNVKNERRKKRSEDIGKQGKEYLRVLKKTTSILFTHVLNKTLFHR